MVIAFNKMDVATRSVKAMKADIEREIERMRKSRGAALEGQDVAVHNLGVEGEEFRLEHAPNEVKCVGIAVRTGLTDSLTPYLERHLAA